MDRRERLLRILIVDDNRDAADSLAMVVRAWGYDVRIAYDGAEGLAQATSFIPDVVLLDIGLPNLDGFQFAQQARTIEALQQTRLISVSAYNDPQFLARLRASGVDEHFPKPIRLLVLKRLLEEQQAALAPPPP